MGGKPRPKCICKGIGVVWTPTGDLVRCSECKTEPGIGIWPRVPKTAKEKLSKSLLDELRYFATTDVPGLQLSITRREAIALLEIIKEAGE